MPKTYTFNRRFDESGFYSGSLYICPEGLKEFFGLPRYATTVYLTTYQNYVPNAVKIEQLPEKKYKNEDTDCTYTEYYTKVNGETVDLADDTFKQMAKELKKTFFVVCEYDDWSEETPLLDIPISVSISPLGNINLHVQYRDSTYTIQYSDLYREFPVAFKDGYPLSLKFYEHYWDNRKSFSQGWIRNTYMSDNFRTLLNHIKSDLNLRDVFLNVENI